MVAERKRVQANGLNFAFTDHGDKSATAVVLLHGYPNNANMWEKQVGAWCRFQFLHLARTDSNQCVKHD